MEQSPRQINTCKRCRKPTTDTIICQSCKSELLSNYEASFDWQTAFEIEKAQLTASRYRSDDADDDDSYY
jgi:hypothetical protein